MDNMRNNELHIHTPEGTLFAIPLAGPVLRAFALCIDIAAMTAIITMIRFAVSLLILLSSELYMTITIFIGFAVSLTYPILLETYWKGQTLGKRFFRIRVIDEQGGQLNPGQVIIRNLLRAVDSLPALYFLGGLFMLGTRHAQRLGDLAAGTVVVRSQKNPIPDVQQISPGIVNSFRRAPHFESRLRRTVQPREAAIAVSALMRRDEMEDEARLDLFHRLAEYFRTLIAFPEDLTTGLSDEQLVRNIIDTLYRQPSDGAFNNGKSMYSGEATIAS